MTAVMTFTTRITAFLTLVILFAVTGCDDVQPTEINQPEAIIGFGKTSAEKDAFCSANPNDNRCTRWCSRPQSNCDNPPPPPSDDPVAAFNFSADQLTVQFTNTSQNDDASAWDFGDGSGSAEDSPSHTYAEQGTYTVSLTVSNDEGSDTASRSVTVSEDTPPPPSDGSIWMAGHSYMRGIETMADLGAELGEYRGGEGFLSTWVERADVAVEPARDYEHAGFIEWLQRQDQVAGSAQAAAQIESIVGYDIAVMVQWFQTEPSCTTHGLTCGPAGQDHFNDLYEQMAQQAGVDLIPVGDAFVNAYNAGVTNLHTDGSHPSAQGEYLRNVTIYSYFSGIDARTMPSLGVASASTLKQAAYDALNGSTPPPPPPGDGLMLDVNGTWVYENVDLPPNAKVCIIGYSNTAQWGSTYLVDLQNRGYTAVNAALGSNALENWATNPSLVDRCGSAPDLIISQVSTQANVQDEAGVANQIRTYLPQLHANIRAKYPNAIVAHFQGEAAHYVDPSKRWGIKEPSRYLHGKYIVEVVAGLQNAVLGPYMWTEIGKANLSTQCGTWTPAMNNPGGNQHPSQLGKEFMSCQAEDWFDRYVN